MDPYSPVPILHSAAYVAATGWSPRSPEQHSSLNSSLAPEWPSSPSSSPTSPSSSSYPHSALGRHGCITTTAATTAACTLYVPSIPTGCNPSPHEQSHCSDSSVWLHPSNVSDQIQQQQQQQSYLNLNLHLHHQISSYPGGSPGLHQSLHPAGNSPGISVPSSHEYSQVRSTENKLMFEFYFIFWMSKIYTK